jgi:uncharacterized protein (TIGR03067 family)
MMARFVLASVVALLVAGFCSADDKKDGKDQLQGEWFVLVAEVGGKKDENLRGKKLVVKGDEWTLPAGGTRKFKIDATKNPKQVDLRADVDGKEQAWQGIYKIEWEILTLCQSADPGGKRPAEFKGGEGVSFMVLGRSELKSFDSDGVKITYLDRGKGEAVVLLHGFSASIGSWWETDVRVELTRDFRVIAPALRGHGRSDKPLDAKKYGAEIAEDVIRLLDHLKIKKAHVVGYSWGSSVAGKLMVSHPDRLLSVTFGGGGPNFRPSKAFVEAIEATIESLEQGKGFAPFVIAFTPDGQPKPSPEQAAAISKMVLGDRDLHEQKALAAVLRSGKELAVTEDQLKANKVPVLFVYGSRESVPFKEGITEAIKVLPTAKVKVVENGDHGSTATSPEFRTTVLEFLRKPNK